MTWALTFGSVRGVMRENNSGRETAPRGAWRALAFRVPPLFGGFER